MRILTLMFAFFCFHSVFAQACYCLTDFEYLKNYRETNHPGLNSNQRKHNVVYKTAANDIQVRITKLNPTEECILYLQEYFDLLNDL